MPLESKTSGNKRKGNEATGSNETVRAAVGSKEGLGGVKLFYTGRIIGRKSPANRREGDRSESENEVSHHSGPAWDPCAGSSLANLCLGKERWDQ